MHAAALAAAGLEDWSYEAIDVAPDGFAERVAALPGEGFAGINVTVPHKAAALELADRPSDAARAIGAANTLSFGEQGVEAENTDAPGFLAAVPLDPAGVRALVLGAGGSARAVVWALVDRGAEVSVWNRTAERAAELAGKLGGTAVDAGQARSRVAQCDLIVNCTTAGLPGSGAGLADLPLDAAALHDGQTVVDLAYGDRETELVAAARAAGATVVDGLEVLVRQGAISFRIWTGIDPSLEVMRAAARVA